MIKIAVVDDDITVCKKIEKYLNLYEFKYEADLSIDLFVSCEELYKSMNAGTIYNLIFLDIEFSGVNGIQMSKFIRNNLKNIITQIIFVSSKQSYAMYLFSVQPFNFLVKPISKESIFNNISRYIDYYNRTNKFFTYTFENTRHKIVLSMIIYVESCGKKLKIHTSNDEITVYRKFSEAMEGELKGQFVIVRRGIAVNIDHIITSDFNKVTLSDKTEIKISRNQQNEVRERISYLVGGK